MGSVISLDSKHLALKVYTLYRVDDPDNTKRRRLHSLLKTQCIISKITFKNKEKDHAIPLHRSPAHAPDQLDKSLESLKELIQNLFKPKSFFVLITGDL